MLLCVGRTGLVPAIAWVAGVYGEESWSCSAAGSWPQARVQIP